MLKPGFYSDFWTWPTLLYTNILYVVSIFALCLLLANLRVQHVLMKSMFGVRSQAGGRGEVAHVSCFPQPVCVCVCVEISTGISVESSIPGRVCILIAFMRVFLIMCPSSSSTSFSRRIMWTAIYFTRMGDAVEIFLNDENAVPAKSLC